MRVTWVKFLRELCGLHGPKYFSRGSTFCVGHKFYVVACVKYISAWFELFYVSFCVGHNFFRGFNIFARVDFLGVLLKKILIGAFKIIS